MNRWRSIPLFSNARNWKTASGFTLLEVLVSVSVIVILLSIVYAVFSSISTAKERLDAGNEAYHRARVIFDRLGREIRGASFSLLSESATFRGGEGRDGIFFFELSTTAVSPASNELLGFSVVRYSVEEDAEENGGGKVLMRSERPLLAQESNRLLPDAIRLAPEILFFKIRFHADNSWHDSWDAAEKGLPELVEVTLRFADDSADGVPFLSTFELFDRESTP